MSCNICIRFWQVSDDVVQWAQWVQWEQLLYEIHLIIICLILLPLLPTVHTCKSVILGQFVCLSLISAYQKRIRALQSNYETQPKADCAASVALPAPATLCSARTALLCLRCLPLLCQIVCLALITTTNRLSYSPAAAMS